MDRLYAMIQAGRVGSVNVVREVDAQIRRKTLEELQRSEVDVIGAFGEVLRPGVHYAEPRGIWKAR